MDDAGHARLTDFGLSTVVPDAGSAGSIKDGHAVRWSAPEVLDKERPVSKESDIFSFAMVVIEVCACSLVLLGCVTYRYQAFTGEAPFHGIPPTTTAVGILGGNRPTRPGHPDFTDSLWNMVKRCWNQDPQRRPEIAEVVHWLRNPSALQHDDDVMPDDATLVSTRQSELPFGEFPFVPLDKPFDTVRRFTLPFISVGDTRVLRTWTTSEVQQAVFCISTSPRQGPNLRR